MKVLSKDHKKLNSYLSAINEWIDLEITKNIPDGSPKDFLYDLIKEYPLRGGKKFRPALVFLCCELFGGDPKEAIITSLAIELFHNFALIHDDIEDRSEIRRGQPTLHKKHGTALAINAGDALFGLVYETLLKNFQILDKDTAIKIYRLINKVIRHTFEGQAMDIGWIEKRFFPNKNEYKKMIVKKTGFYSGRGPCQFGALIGKASRQEINTVGIFGETIGIGFQIRDDLLNLTEKNELKAPTPGSGGYGKEWCGDIVEGKRTLITIELLDRLSKKDSNYLKKILLKSRSEVSSENIDWVINKAHKTGAIEEVSKQCITHAKIASKLLEKLPLNPAKMLLDQITNYLTLERKA